ncbi:hypothetical protein ACV22V_13070 [Burkholderia sp. AW33-5]
MTALAGAARCAANVDNRLSRSLEMLWIRTVSEHPEVELAGLSGM